MARATKVRKKPRKTTPTTETSVEYLEEGETVEPSDSFLDYCILIYGESGIGKTSVASKIPGAYVIQCDPNRKGLRIRQTCIDNLTIETLKKLRPSQTPWDKICFLIDRACEDASVQCVVIDNFGLFYEHALRHRCYKQMISDPSEENDYGQTWRAIETEMTEQLNKLLYAEKGIVLIAHDVSKEADLPDGSKFERIEPSMMKAAFKWIKACTNFAFYMAHGEDGRIMKLRGGRDVWLKCCTDEDNTRFFDPEGNPLHEINMGTSPKQAWVNLMLAWDNKIQDVNHKDTTKKLTKRRKKTSK